jgi:DNA modification methylase
MSILIHGDCNVELLDIDDASVDVIFCDLPYATKKDGKTTYSAVSCKWNTPVDLDILWKHFMRIKKLHTPIILTCNTKFGVDLINSAPKKCPFRYDIVWQKSSSCSFLLSKVMPLRQHEMIYFFYEKKPFYDISSHKHKFIKNVDNLQRRGQCYDGNPCSEMGPSGKYEPKLPTSVIERENKDTTYGDVITHEIKARKKGESRYNPPLPKSVLEEDIVKRDKETTHQHTNQPRIFYKDKDGNLIKEGQSGKHQSKYEPKLPTSIIEDIDGGNGKITEEYTGNYGKLKCPDYIINNNDRNKIRRENKKNGLSESAYEPPLPTSVIDDEDIVDEFLMEKQNIEIIEEIIEDKKIKKTECYGDVEKFNVPHTTTYDPALPTSLLKVKSTRGHHATEKPVALMEWILKYYSKENDTILDATAGSMSMGIACLNMKRNFIAIEKDDDIYDYGVKRMEEHESNL